MKISQLFFFLNLLFLFTNCNGQTKKPEEEKPKIHIIVTNDYMSARNLSFMGGPTPSRLTYKHPLIDSLANCFVEIFDNNENVIEKKYYNKIGALYQTNKNFYDNRNRLEKSIEIDEFKNDTCLISYRYKDSLNLITHKQISSSCDKDILDFYYKYDVDGNKTEVLINENDTLYSKDYIQNISKNEKRIKSYDNANRLSTFVYKYNDKDLLVYEKRKEWDYITRGDYFEKQQENEILYKYDKNGNWIERTTQTYCLPVKPKPTKKAQKNEPPKIKEIGVYEEDCKPEIKEKLTRKIYYK